MADQQRGTIQNHYVNVAHLRRFAEKSGLLWVFDKVQKCFFRSSVRKVARQRGFYSDEDESKLSTLVEAPANQIIEKICQLDPITDAERDLLAYYLGVYLMRVPERRKRAEEMAPKVIDDTVSEVAEEIRRRVSEGFPGEIAQKRLDELEVLRSESKATFPPGITDLIRSPWPTNQVVGCIAQMTWRFAVTEGPNLFITSDNPFFFFRSFGLGRTESEFCFPVSSHIAILGSRNVARDGRYIAIRQQFVKEVNRRLASAATRFLFHREPSPWLRILGEKEEPYLSRFNWT